MPKAYKSIEEIPLPSLEDFRETVRHLRPEVGKLAQRMSDAFSKTARELSAEDPQAFSNVEAEALFVGALVVALSIKHAAFPENLPQELQDELDEMARQMKYGGN